MADNISPEEIKRRLILFLRIPNETWTDVLKLFSRRVLVQQFSPACYRLKEICNVHVKCVHVIENAGQFTRKLDRDDPEAIEQLGHLDGNGCHLAEQFRLIQVSISSERSLAILRHCPDLFDGCQIERDLNWPWTNRSLPLFLACLGQLEKAKPVVISVSQRVDEAEVVVDFWHHPTFQLCSRVDLDFTTHLSSAMRATAFANIFDWLHHQCDDDGSAADQQQQLRCMIIWISHSSHTPGMDWLIDRCSEDIQRSHGPADRRQYAIGFAFGYDCIYNVEWAGFGQFRRIENNSTGEVLVLERKINAKGDPTDSFRLRRCMAGEKEANGPEFYAGMFECGAGRFDQFKIDRKKAAKVTIG